MVTTFENTLWNKGTVLFLNDLVAFTKDDIQQSSLVLPKSNKDGCLENIIIIESISTYKLPTENQTRAILEVRINLCLNSPDTL